MANFTAEKCCVLEDISENLPGYGNHKNALHSKIIGNCNIQNCFVNVNGLTVSTKIWNLHLWSDDSLNETEISILKNRTMHLQISSLQTCPKLYVNENEMPSNFTKYSQKQNTWCLYDLINNNFSTPAPHPPPPKKVTPQMSCWITAQFF